MRNLKKFLALVLAMMMALSLMVTANAQNAKKEYDDVADAKFSEAIDVLTGMGVFKGHDGDFRPTEIITRAEAAAVLYRLTTGDVEDKQVELYAPQAYRFTDVTPGAWYAGYVGFAVDAGYVKGYNGEFMPSKPVTGYEMLAMLLRAVGYGKNGEFTGDAWRINVGATAQSLKILKPIESTHYANTLSQGSAREVVAGLSFVTATEVPTVTWTMLGGYNEYNTILQGGDKNPTLGEREFGLTSTTSIILGNQATGESGTLLSATEVSYTATVDEKDVTKTTGNPNPYAYPGVKVDKGDVADDAKEDIKIPAGVKLDIKTGLDLFGHKVTAWHNGNGHGYAVIDESSLSTVVYAPKATDGEKLSDSGYTTNAAAAGSLGAAAKAAGFDVDLEGSKAHESQVYARISTDADVKVSAASPNGMYALISNNGDKTVDVIIALSAEVAEIIQKNTVASTQTLTLAGRGTAATDPAQDLDEPAFGDKGLIKVKSLVDGSETTLGSKVIAWEVKGTANKTAYAADDADTYGNKATNGNMPYYQLDKVDKTITGTVLSYDVTDNGKLTMSDGTVYERSYLWSKVVKGAIQSPLNGDGKVEFGANVNYTVWLDNDGRWLGATTATSDFIYATYADYSVGGLGSAEMKYYVTGVTLDGQPVHNAPMISLLQEKASYPSKEKTLGDGYNAMKVSKKDMGAADNGNQILVDKYTGYLKDAEGNFDADDLGAVQLLSGKTWTIEKKDVANGFADLEDDGTLVATKDTKFVLVSGTGINDVKAEVLTGIEALLKGYSKVVLNADEGAKGNTYYIMASDRFNKVDTSKNTLVDTVILDARDLKYIGVSTLFFALSENTTDVVLAGEDADTVKQYKLYNDGVLGTYFVTTDTETYKGAVAPTGGDDGNFFELTEEYKVGSVPVYSAKKIEESENLDLAGNDCEVGVTYQYVGVSNLETAFLEKGTGKTLAKVAGATVVDVEFSDDCDHDEIKNVEDLNRAVSGDDKLDVTIAIVNDGVNVSMIYVTEVKVAAD